MTGSALNLAGSDGKSAYEIAVDNGFVGTESDWLTSLQGADGADGADGLSTIAGATDLSGSPTNGYGFIYDSGAGVFVWTNLATQSELDTHTGATTGAHGGIVSSADSRLTDTRTPTDASVTLAKLAAALKPSGSAATTDEAVRALGTGANNAAAGNDSRLSDSRAPSGSAGGALAGSYPSPDLASSVAGSGLGISSNVLAVNVDSSTIEVNSDTLRVKALGITDSHVAAANKDGTAGTASMRTLGTSSTSAAAGNDSRLSDSRAPNGSAGGALTGTYPNPTIATAGVTSLNLAAEFLAFPRTLFFSGVRLATAATAGDYPLFVGGQAVGTALAAGSFFSSSGSAGASVFYFDPAVYALTGLTTKLRVDSSLLTNSNAPTVTFTVGLYPVSSVAGGTAANTVTVGTVTVGSTIAFTTQAASTRGQGSSTNFTAPSAGYYALGVNVSSTAAANSCEYITATLSVHWV